ncbi:uncharacterized protein LOC110919223 [Helianthus annuus]|uniref:uncharacterized protein LOC110919223 n=1 Tax=Helianthus annuus TaxID=4232 RepID=UPI000B8FC099|nr:uncharacterized protein LOC110919223 [Helianthus annuus]
MGDKDSSSPPENKTPTLHPVYTVTNIQNKVLDGEKVSYSSWVKLFMLHATGYEVVCHIDGTPSPDEKSPEFTSWKKIDAIVLQWIYDTLSDDLLVRVLTDKSTAYEAWQRVKRLFVNNKGSCAQALQQELTNLKLASLPSLEAYCQRIRELCDQLVAVDIPVTDNQRVLYLVSGLPREYDTIGTILNNSLPSWEDAVDQLQSEARRLAARDALNNTPVIAVAITNPSPNNPSREQPTNNYSTRSNRYIVLVLEDCCFRR